MRLAMLLAALAVLLGALVQADSLRAPSKPLELIETTELVEAKPVPKPKACWKEGEGRGVGVLPERGSKTCPISAPERSMGLCYPKCKDKEREGFGPVCWDNCAYQKYHANGIVFCCDTDDTCSELISLLALKLPKALVKFLTDIAVNPANAIGILRDFRALVQSVLQLSLPLCPNVKDGFWAEEPMSESSVVEIKSNSAESVRVEEM